MYKGIRNITEDVYFFPMDEFATTLAVSSSPDLKIIRIDTLNNIVNNKKILVTNLSGYLKKTDRDINNIIINFKTRRKDIISFLENNSYIKTNLVSTTGEYAVRSFIIDIYPLNSEKPVRIEFFGDDIESIRLFDEESQISKENIKEIKLYSFSDENNKCKENIVDKLNNPITIFLDYKKILNTYNTFLDNRNEFKIDNNVFSNLDELYIDKKIFINTLSDEPINKDIIKYNSRE